MSASDEARVPNQTSIVDEFRWRLSRLPTWQSLRVQSKPIRNVNELHAARLSRLERVAMVVTDRVGTMGFFLIILTWTILWLGWNFFGPSSLRFDPYPAFVLWLFIERRAVETPPLQSGEERRPARRRDLLPIYSSSLEDVPHWWCETDCSTQAAPLRGSVAGFANDNRTGQCRRQPHQRGCL